MKYKFVYFTVSAIVIVVGVFSLFTWGLKMGIDFKGGTILEYQIKNEIDEDVLKTKIKEQNVELNSISLAGDRYTIKLSPVTEEQKVSVKKIISDVSSSTAEELRFEMVGPSVGPDLIKKTVIALGLSAITISFWIAFQFKSIKFGVSAVLAMLHDSLVLIGMYSILGHFFGAEVDFLFVTAVLTILSFSVHDTIVVYDRIREVQKRVGGSIYDIANLALSETMVRSLNNSFTIVFMLTALVLMGGESIKWFAIALLIGTVSGTYSSPFVAVPILVTWDEVVKKFKK